MKLICLCNVNKTYCYISLIEKLCYLICYLMFILIFDYELKKF